MKKLLMLLFLTSCVSIIDVPKVSKEIKTDVESYLPKIEKEKGQICFYRLKAYVGFANSADIFVDGKKIGEISNNSYFCKNFVPGEYEIRFDGLITSSKYTKVAVSKNKRNYVRITYDSHQRIDEIKEIPALGYLYTIIHKDEL